MVSVVLVLTLVSGELNGMNGWVTCSTFAGVEPDRLCDRAILSCELPGEVMSEDCT